jgi:hypothetical protein
MNREAMTLKWVQDVLATLKIEHCSLSLRNGRWTCALGLNNASVDSAGKVSQKSVEGVGFTAEVAVFNALNVVKDAANRVRA